MPTLSTALADERGRILTPAPHPRPIPSPHDGEVGRGLGRGDSKERDNSMERAPLPRPLPARASQGEGAGDFSDGGCIKMRPDERQIDKFDVQFTPRLANIDQFMHWRSSRIMRSIGCVPGVALVALAGAAGLCAFMDFCPRASGAEIKAAAYFRKDIQPILAEYCYDCHGDGMDKGNVAFDELKSDEELLGKRDLWWAVLKNLRAGLMPPAKKPRPPEKEKRRLEDWIKYEAFGIDPKNPDPGRVTLRRLNRVEYRNTIRDLMGIEFKAAEEFPPDDTGYGFDNIGDVLTVSPLLLEKYMQAAETIVAAAVPTVA